MGFVPVCDFTSIRFGTCIMHATTQPSPLQCFAPTLPPHSAPHSPFQTVARSLRAARCLIAAGLGSPRERTFAAAAHAWACGRPRLAAALLESILLRHPTDVLALRAAHDTHFFIGDGAQLRASPARVFREWDPSMPGYGNVCGMLAFGCVREGGGGRAWLSLRCMPLHCCF